MITAKTPGAYRIQRPVNKGYSERITKERVDELCAQGLCWAEIAAILEVSPASLRLKRQQWRREELAASGKTKPTLTQIKTALHIRAGANSILDLCARTGKARSTIYFHLEQLQQAGIITWQPRQARTLRLTEQGQAALADYCLIPGGVGKIERI